MGGTMPPTPSFFSTLIQRFDRDGDGKVSYDEFTGYFLPRLAGHEDSIASWATLWRTFNSIDVDHNGKICLKELNTAMRNSPEVQKLFGFNSYQSSEGKGKGSVPPAPAFLSKSIEQLDRDGDGQISWPEFVGHFREAP